VSAFTRPYARAFLEAAPAGYDVARFLEAGETLARAIAANPELRAFLLAPNVPREAKSKAVAALAAKAGVDAYGTRLLQVMLHNHRVLEAAEVFQALRDANDDRQNILRVRVTTATALTDAEKKAVEDALAARTGKVVKSQIDLDPGLIGGFVARAGSQIFDGSVAAAIRRFQTQAKERTGA
jgi:F-type H+-transporting ATPase subunit delta